MIEHFAASVECSNYVVEIGSLCIGDDRVDLGRMEGNAAFDGRFIVFRADLVKRREPIRGIPLCEKRIGGGVSFLHPVVDIEKMSAPMATKKSVTKRDMSLLVLLGFVSLRRNSLSRKSNDNPVKCNVCLHAIILCPGYRF